MKENIIGVICGGYFCIMLVILLAVPEILPFEPAGNILFAISFWGSLIYFLSSSISELTNDE